MTDGVGTRAARGENTCQSDHDLHCAANMVAELIIHSSDETNQADSRVGDFDAFALMKLLAPESGLDLPTIWSKLGKASGLLGISGISSDLREVQEAAAQGNDRAKLAVDAFVESVRHYVGSYLAVLNGADALVFTGGIGQNAKAIRKAICDNLQFAGIELDETKNQNANGSEETAIHAANSKTQIWVAPTNEELIVARQTADVLSQA